jgi:hypothetical protein
MMDLVIRFVRPWRWADTLSANTYGIPGALFVCAADTVRGIALAEAGIRKGPCRVARNGGYELGDGSG